MLCNGSTFRQNEDKLTLGLQLLVTHAGIVAGMGRAFSRVCLSMCQIVRALKGKRLELLTPNLVQSLGMH